MTGPVQILHCGESPPHLLCSLGRASVKWDKYPHGPSVVEAPSKCLGFSVQPGDHYGLKCGLLGHVWSPLNSHGRVWQRGHGRRSGCWRGLAPGAGRNWLLHPPQVCGNCGWAPQGLRWDTGMKTCFLRDKRLRESSPCLPGCVCVCMCVCVCVWSSEWRVRVCVCVCVVIGMACPCVCVASGHTGRKLRALL